jgi:hypothetical protein
VNEDSWRIENGSLVFYNSQGRVNATFTDALMGPEGVDKVLALRGPIGNIDQRDFLILRAVPHPAPVVHDGEIELGAPPVITATAATRPNLVVLRAGESSIHAEWLKDAADEGRTWDLCISYYGKDTRDLVSHHEYLTHQPHQRKFEALYDLFSEESPLWRYERIWFPDDDLLTTSSDIDRMFHLSRKHGLALCQPSLQQVPACHITHAITAQVAGQTMRFTTFVEVMCPLFSREALRICIGTFKGSKTGFGLDHLWPALLGWPRSKIAILDNVALIHTRPFGQNYDLDFATREEVSVRHRYGLGHHWIDPVAIP